MDEIAKAQKLVSDGPVTFVAAMFAVLAIALLFLFIRTKERHAKEISELHKANIDRAIKLEVALHGLLEFTEHLRDVLADFKRRSIRRESAPKETKP